MRSAVILAALAGAAMLPLAANATLFIVGSTVPFVDIGVSGTSIGSVSDDSEIDISAASLTAAGFTGNALLAGGVAVRVGNNGAVIWNPSGVMEIGWANANAANSVNQSMNSLSSTIAITDSVNGNGHSTTAGGSRQFLAVLWDDNFPSSSAVPPTNTRWQVIGGDLIIQWTNEDHFNAQGAGFVTYEMIVRGTVAPGGSFVDYVYQDTLYQTNQYQDDGGSASIGYADWGVTGQNNVEWGQSGGSGNSTTDPAFGDASMRPKVSGYVASNNPAFTHAVSIIPTPGSLALVGLGGLIVARRRRA